MKAPKPPTTYPCEVVWVDQAGQECSRILRNESQFWQWHFINRMATWSGGSLVERPKDSMMGMDDGLAKEKI